MENNQIPNVEPVETPVAEPVVVEAAAPAAEVAAAPAQPTYATQPAYTAQPAGQVVKGGSKALSIIAMICGICAMVFFWYPFLGLLCGIAGIILGSIAKKKGANGMNKTGLILGIIGTVLGAIFTVVMIAALAESASYDYSYSYYTALVSNLLK